MLTASLHDALNQQLNEELFSSNLYLSLSAFLDDRSLEGMAKWMRRQAHEERKHMMKFYEFIRKRGGRVRPTGLPQPPTDWGSAREAFETALAHEVKMSQHINELVNLADAEKDRATSGFLRGFVATQAEEEATLSDIVAKLGAFGTDPNGLLSMDRHLS